MRSGPSSRTGCASARATEVKASYAASKSGLFGLTKTLALEAAFQLKRAGKLTEDGIGITVNTVAPGFIATEMLEHVTEKVLDGIKEM